MKVVVDKDIKNFIDLVNELDGLQDIKFTYVTSKEINNDLLIDADVLFVRSTTKIDKKLLENSSVNLSVLLLLELIMLILITWNHLK